MGCDSLKKFYLTSYNINLHLSHLGIEGIVVTPPSFRRGKTWMGWYILHGSIVTLADNRISPELCNTRSNGLGKRDRSPRRSLNKDLPILGDQFIRTGFKLLGCNIKELTPCIRCSNLDSISRNISPSPDP